MTRLAAFFDKLRRRAARRRAAPAGRWPVLATAALSMAAGQAHAEEPKDMTEAPLRLNVDEASSTMVKFQVVGASKERRTGVYTLKVESSRDAGSANRTVNSGRFDVSGEGVVLANVAMGRQPGAWQAELSVQVDNGSTYHLTYHGD